jgi:hypothetical protein
LRAGIAFLLGYEWIRHSMMPDSLRVAQGELTGAWSATTLAACATFGSSSLHSS